MVAYARGAQATTPGSTSGGAPLALEFVFDFLDHFGAATDRPEGLCLHFVAQASVDRGAFALRGVFVAAGD